MSYGTIEGGQREDVPQALACWRALSTIHRWSQPTAWDRATRNQHSIHIHFYFLSANNLPHPSVADHASTADRAFGSVAKFAGAREHACPNSEGIG